MTWKQKSSRPIYKNPWIEVVEDIVVDDFGRDQLYGVVSFHEGSCVLPIDDEGNVYLAEQFRYGANQRSIEAPGGAIDPGELPLDAAKRELVEELTLTPQEWIACGYIRSLTGVVRHKEYLYIAKQFTPVDSVPVNEEENISLVKMSLEEAVQAVMDSKIMHAPSCTLILKAAILKKDSE